MKQELKQEIALMRYGAIAPLISGLDEDYPSQNAFYEEVSARGIAGPDGKVRHYAPATIEKWYLNYKKYGFDALVPKARADAGMRRKLDDDLQEQIRYLKPTIPGCLRLPSTGSWEQMALLLTDRCLNPQSAVL